MIAYDIALEELQQQLNTQGLWLPKHHLSYSAQTLTFPFDVYLYGFYAKGLTTIEADKPLLTNVWLNGYLPIKTQLIKAQTPIVSNRVCVFHFGTNELLNQTFSIFLLSGHGNTMEIDCVPYEKIVLRNGETTTLPLQEINFNFTGDFASLQLNGLTNKPEPKHYTIVMEVV